VPTLLAMLVWSLVLSLATLQVAQAYPTPNPPQYSSFGEHGGVATEVRAYRPRFFSISYLDRLGNAQRSGSIFSPKVEARLML